MREPAVFLLDEPLSNLDAKLRVEARTFISKLHQRLGTTFIYVTHDQVEAMTMGQRICVLNAGRLMQIDTPTNLYDHPAECLCGWLYWQPVDELLRQRDPERRRRQDGGRFRLVPGGSARSNVTISIVHTWARSVIFGIRPENISHADFVAPGIVPSRIQANVDVVEEMGHEKILYLEEGGKNFLARIDPRAMFTLGSACAGVQHGGHASVRRRDRAGASVSVLQWLEFSEPPVYPHRRLFLFCPAAI